jgi:hypothetical protein
LYIFEKADLAAQVLEATSSSMDSGEAAVSFVDYLQTLEGRWLLFLDVIIMSFDFLTFTFFW